MTVKIKAGEEFLGIGLFGPLRIDHTGEFEVKAGRDLVVESVRAILETTGKFVSETNFVAGERFMRGALGTTIKTMRHENLDDDTIDLAESIYIEAIEQFEPRAFVKDITSKVKGESLETEITLELEGANTTANLVVIRDARGRITTNLRLPGAA